MNKLHLHRLIVVIGITMLITMIVIGNGAPASVKAGLGANQQARIYLYDPTSSQFVFTYDVQSSYGDAKDIVVHRDGSVYEVWFTLRDADQIARLDYTNQTTHSITYYDVPSGSGPANLLYSNGAVWFTAPGGNYVGHLDPGTGTVTQVSLPTPNSFPADLDVASDGSIWFTEFNTGQLGHITGTGPYTLEETSEAGWTESKPYGIAIDNSDAIYIASTAQDYVMHYRPSTGDRVKITDWIAESPRHPYRLIMDQRNTAWGTVWADNAIEMFDSETVAYVYVYQLTKEASLPVAIDVDSDNYLWVAQQNSAQISYLDADTLFSTPVSINLPQVDDMPVGIATDDLDRVWVLVRTDSQFDVFLPVLSLSD